MARLRVSFFLFLLIISIATAKTEIKLKKTAEIQDETIYLSDVAYIISDNRSFADFLSKIQVGKLEGKFTRISQKEIKKILKDNYVDTGNIIISGAPFTVVKRKILILTPEKIETDIADFLKNRYSDIKIVNINIPKKEIKIYGKFKKVIKELNRTGSYIYLNYRIFSNGKEIKKYKISVKYRQLRTVLAAKKDIKRGQIITEEDLMYIKTDRSGRNFLTEKDQVIGGTAKTDILKGDIIKTNMVIPDYKVKKKDYVKVIYYRKNIRIEIVGQALQNGKIGDFIKVKNLSSGKVLECKVIGENTVLYTGG
ncbi:flagellar basal body P-ring formation chaperone FlgA [Persephonella sp.]